MSGMEEALLCTTGSAHPPFILPSFERAFMTFPKRLFFLILVGLTGLAHVSVPANSSISGLPFQSGESLTYRVSWANIVEAGTAQLNVTSAPGAPNLLRLELRAKPAASMAATYPFSDEFVSHFDSILRAPSLYEKNFKERERSIKERIAFDQARRIATFQNSKKQSKSLPIELGTQDPVSALYALRCLGLSPGVQATFPVLDSGIKYWLEARVTGIELITIKLGSFNAHRVEINLRKESGMIENRQITAWFATNARRLPVLVTVALPVGAAVIELAGQAP